MPAAWDSG